MKEFKIAIDVEKGMKMSEIEDIIDDVLNPAMEGTYNVEWTSEDHDAVIVSLESEDDNFKLTDIEDELGERLSDSGFECYYRFVEN